MSDKLTLGYFESNRNIERRILWVLRSGRLSYGPMSVQMEKLVSSIIGVRHTILCNSGTSALIVAIQALKELRGWEDGDEIICPALTFVATINAVLHCGLTPVLVDVDPLTYIMHPEDVTKAITERTRGVLPVHLFGYPCDMPGMVRLADFHNLVIIEDCCEAFGAESRGQHVGSIGHVGCFSTYVGHHIVTGVGGFCTTSDKEIALKIRSLVNHGIDIDQLPAGEVYEPSQLGRIFRFSDIGHSFRITELEAALGIEALEHWEKNRNARRENVDLYNLKLSSLGVLQLPRRGIGDDVDNYMVLPLVCTRMWSRDVIAALNNRNIEARMMMPLTNQPCYEYDENDFPNAKHINHYGFYIGCHEGLSKKDILNAVSTLEGILINA